MTRTGSSFSRKTALPCAAAVPLVSCAAPASTGPENTPAAQSSETAIPDEELLLAEAEFLTGRLVKHVFDGTIRDGISDINTAMEQDPGIPLRLSFILPLDLDDAGLYCPLYRKPRLNGSPAVSVLAVQNEPVAAHFSGHNRRFSPDAKQARAGSPRTVSTP